MMNSTPRHGDRVTGALVETAFVDLATCPIPEHIAEESGIETSVDQHPHREVNPVRRAVDTVVKAAEKIASGITTTVTEFGNKTDKQMLTADNPKEEQDAYTQAKQEYRHSSHNDVHKGDMELDSVNKMYHLEQGHPQAHYYGGTPSYQDAKSVAGGSVNSHGGAVSGQIQSVTGDLFGGPPTYARVTSNAMTHVPASISTSNRIIDVDGNAMAEPNLQPLQYKLGPAKHHSHHDQMRGNNSNDHLAAGKVTSSGGGAHGPSDAGLQQSLSSISDAPLPDIKPGPSFARPAPAEKLSAAVDAISHVFGHKDHMHAHSKL